jgi:hypothetical protein
MRRTVYVQAVSLCNISLLHKNDFDDIVGEFPDHNEMIRAKADQQPSAMIMAPNVPQDPSNATTMAGPGGPSPGAGKAKLDAGKTAQTKADGSSVVNAKSGNEGASSTRSIDGGVKQESAARTAQETSVDFINEQEAALDDAALPPQRREQVRRYFGELRKRFETK